MTDSDKSPDSPDSPARLFRELLLAQAQAGHIKTHNIQLNRLWYEPSVRKIVTDTVARFVRDVASPGPDTVIVCPEGIRSTFGAVPIAATLADQIGCRLCYWVENADTITSRPLLYPRVDTEGTRCIVLTDVIGRGTILRKLASSISLPHSVLVVAMVQISSHRQELDRTLRDVGADLCLGVVPFFSIVATKEIGW